MRIGIDYGEKHIEWEVSESGLVKPAPPKIPALSDPAAAVRDALENPSNWPALRRAVTSDDHVAIVVDEHLPRLAELLVPILEHLQEAQVPPDAVTIVTEPSASKQQWVDELPERFEDVHVEVHDPADRRKLSYLATTRQGRRIYLNRTVVDAEQIVVLSGRRFDPLLGYAGAEAAIYPLLSDAETRAEYLGHSHTTVAGKRNAPGRQEAVEVAWLLGAPFLLQVIEGNGDEIAHIIGGSLDSSTEGMNRQDALWRYPTAERTRLVVAGIGGDPARHDFKTLAQALANAAELVEPDGRIVLLSQATPELSGALQIIREAEEADEAENLLKEHTDLDRRSGIQWTSAVARAKVYLLSGLSEEIAEELFTVPLDRAEQVQKLLDGSTCLLVPDAQKILPVIDRAPPQ